MGRETDLPDSGSRWPRTVAHLAIVVVFVLAALGYAPFREHASGARTVAGSPNRATTVVVRACEKPPGDAPAGNSQDLDSTKAGVETFTHDCERPKAELALVQKQHGGGVALPDVRRALDARPAQ
jgi:hypothetical protein